jgi:uncharacterized membrane protein
MTKKNKSQEHSPNVYASESKGVSGQIELTQKELHVGDFPSPQLLKGYNEISPEFAERVLVVLEIQQKHRMDLELRELESKEHRNDKILHVLEQNQIDDKIYSERGQDKAFWLAVLFFAVLALAIIFRLENAAIAGFVAVASVYGLSKMVGLFVNKSHEYGEKDEDDVIDDSKPGIYQNLKNKREP